MRVRLLSQGLRISVVALAMGPFMVTPAWSAQSDSERIAELERKLDQSNQLIQQLARRLGELEKSSGAPAMAAAPVTASSAPVATAQTERIDALERNLTQIAESAARAPSNAGLPLHGFADVGYVNSSKTAADGRQNGFVLGDVDFYLTPEFGDHVKTLIELNFEWNEAGVLTTDTERMQIGYTFNDSLTLWAGRFHTPYGYWSTAFHHGAQIQTSIDRPKMVAFEDQGGIMPAHTVGLWATGQSRVGDGKIGYDLYTGNGDRILDGTLDFNAVKDDNGNSIFGGSLRYQFGGALDGLTLGTHAFSQVVSSYTGGVLANTTKVNMWGGYGFYDADQWEIISEYYKFNNDDQSFGTGSHSSWAGFVQFGRTLANVWTPYVRFEKADLDQRDMYFASQDSGRSYTRQVLGVRYDINPKAAVKLEVKRTDETPDGGQNSNEAKLQYSVRF